jgi:hypothetical protein
LQKWEQYVQVDWADFFAPVEVKGTGIIAWNKKGHVFLCHILKNHSQRMSKN